MSRNTLLLSAALLAITPSFAPAGELVPGKPETASGRVALAGLDLSTAAGMAQAHKRLTILAERFVVSSETIEKPRIGRPTWTAFTTP